jgi:hypothetical protein
MKYLIPVLFFLLIVSCSERQPDQVSSETAEAELEELLDDFLQGASVNNAEMHDRFWAEDLIYTSSAGERITKADIMNGFDSDQPTTDESSPQYGYEELQILVFDDTAVVAFQLVSTEGEGDSLEVMTYYNTGTFINRNDQWRAVAWQATRIP